MGVCEKVRERERDNESIWAQKMRHMKLKHKEIVLKCDEIYF